MVKDQSAPKCSSMRSVATRDSLFFLGLVGHCLVLCGWLFTSIAGPPCRSNLSEPRAKGPKPPPLGVLPQCGDMRGQEHVGHDRELDVLAPAEELQVLAVIELGDGADGAGDCQNLVTFASVCPLSESGKGSAQGLLLVGWLCKHYTGSVGSQPRSLPGEREGWCLAPRRSASCWSSRRRPRSTQAGFRPAAAARRSRRRRSVNHVAAVVRDDHRNGLFLSVDHHAMVRSVPSMLSRMVVGSVGMCLFVGVGMGECSRPV